MTSQLASANTESEKMEAGLTAGNTVSCWVLGSWGRGPTAGCVTYFSNKAAGICAHGPGPEPVGGHWEDAG